MIEIKNVTKKYGSKRAVDNVSFDVNDGDIFAFIGHNGAGKTTLIKMLNGLLTPTHGTILIKGNAPGIETKAVVSYLRLICLFRKAPHDGSHR